MKFFSRESSEKLAKLGCVGDIGSGSFVYLEQDLSRFGTIGDKLILRSSIVCEDANINLIPAFTPFDFLSDTEISKENCRKLWGENNDPNNDWGHDLFSSRDDSGTKAFECTRCGAIANKDAIYSGAEMSQCKVPEWDYQRKRLLDSPDQIAFIEGFLK